LVLLLEGQVNEKRIRDFKRTQDFTVEDFRTLSQVSDLTDLSGREAVVIRQLFKTTIEVAEETYDTAKHLVRHPLFERFGLGDASVAAVCQRDVVVLTADVQLQVALGCFGLDAINFNHVRALGWR
jgi:hypothetical protein